jgi:hypothetical protein
MCGPGVLAVPTCHDSTLRWMSPNNEATAGRIRSPRPRAFRNPIEPSPRSPALPCYARRPSVMSPSRQRAWPELLQLVPIISLALPFIVKGEVNLGQAGTGFLVATALAIPISIVVVLRGYLLNPILVGTHLWLALGAVAFGLDIQALVGWLAETQAFGLFLAAALVGAAATLFHRYGFVATRSEDAPWVRRASLGLLALSVVVLGWAWLFRHDVRLGGGLPFIVLNVVRRVLCVRGQRRAPGQLVAG